MIDLKTAFLIATAVGTPLILQGASRAGVPIPVVITAGQAAAIAAFPATVCGVSSASPGTAKADTSTMFARWNAINGALKASQGSSSGGKVYPGHPEWTPTNFAKLTIDQAVEFANAIIAAADAGAAVADGYDTGASALGVVLSNPIADSGPYQDLKGLISVESSYGADQSDADDFGTAILSLVLECDDRGYLVAGRPFVPTLGGGLSAAGAAVGSFVEGIAGKAAGTAISLAAAALLSTPGLILIGGLIFYRAGVV